MRTQGDIGHPSARLAVRSAILKGWDGWVKDASLTTGAMAISVVSGLVFWATSGNTKLGHEVVAIIATVTLLVHFWFHRTSLQRIIGRR